MEKIEIVLRREQNNRNGIYLNYINGYWYTYEWSAFCYVCFIRKSKSENVLECNPMKTML